jgi:sulfide:quinone oxidoreductase
VSNQKETIKFDFLHLVPPMSPHSYIKDSGLANEGGYVNVDKHTLQHVKYPNIWSLGDCAGIPASKTAAAIFSQTEVVIKYFVNNLET